MAFGSGALGSLSWQNDGALWHQAETSLRQGRSPAPLPTHCQGTKSLCQLTKQGSGVWTSWCVLCPPELSARHYPPLPVALLSMAYTARKFISTDRVLLLYFVSVCTYDSTVQTCPHFTAICSRSPTTIISVMVNVVPAQKTHFHQFMGES